MCGFRSLDLNLITNPRDISRHLWAKQRCRDWTVKLLTAGQTPRSQLRVSLHRIRGKHYFTYKLYCGNHNSVVIFSGSLLKVIYKYLLHFEVFNPKTLTKSFYPWQLRKSMNKHCKLLQNNLKQYWEKIVLSTKTNYKIK